MDAVFLVGAALIAVSTFGAGCVTWVWAFSGISDRTGLQLAVGWCTVFWVGVVFVMFGARGLT